VEVQIGVLQDTDTSHIFQETQQGHSSLPAMDAPPALLHDNQPAEMQKTHITQSQPGQMGMLVKASMGLDSTTCTKSELVASTLKE